MGVTVKFTREFRAFKKGDVKEFDRGFADGLVNYRKAAVFVDPQENPRTQRLETMVPHVPGLQTLVQAVTGKKRRTA